VLGWNQAANEHAWNLGCPCDAMTPCPACQAAPSPAPAALQGCVLQRLPAALLREWHALAKFEHWASCTEHYHGITRAVPVRYLCNTQVSPVHDLCITMALPVHYQGITRAVPAEYHGIKQQETMHALTCSSSSQVQLHAQPHLGHPHPGPGHSAHSALCLATPHGIPYAPIPPVGQMFVRQTFCYSLHRRTLVSQDLHADQKRMPMVH